MVVQNRLASLLNKLECRDQRFTYAMDEKLPVVSAFDLFNPDKTSGI